MKHLKKYNESKDDVDIEYIKDCFIEFKDNSKYEYEIEEDNHDTYLIGIGINILPTLPEIDMEHTISELVEFSNSLNNFYLDVENCVNKVKLKYPNIYVMCEEGIYTEKGKMNRRYLWIRFS